jgi:hypothetical protein
LATVNISCQTIEPSNNLHDAFLSFACLSKENQLLLHYYTGLETIRKLHSVFDWQGPAVHCQKYYRTSFTDQMSAINQLILMLAKLHQGLGYLPLSKFFGVLTSKICLLYIMLL